MITTGALNQSTAFHSAQFNGVIWNSVYIDRNRISVYAPPSHNGGDSR